MKQLLLLSAIITFNSLFPAQVMDRSTQQLTNCIFHEAGNMWYKKNNFGDIFPQWQEIPHEKLSERLSNFVNLFKDTVPETPFIVEVPHEKAAGLDAIKKAGFIFYHGNNDKSEWIFKNNSSIPEPYTSVIGTQLFIRKNNTVLVMEEKTRPGFVSFPGGTADFNELTRNTAVRELKEEVNLDVHPNDLALFAIINTVKINRFNANSANYYFVVDHSKISGELLPNPNEVIRTFYVQLENLAAEKPVNGLAVIPSIAALAQHLLNKNAPSHHEALLEYRQLRKKDSERNQNDTMSIEFFAQ
jgi:ADP-ribose pyrophosphatase YjhB (NUDIX family)